MDTKIRIPLKTSSHFSKNRNGNSALVSLERKEKLLDVSGNLSDDISLYELYKTERDECDSYRLIFTVNPICSNVLFNSVTEIVKDEGSDSAVCLNFIEESGWTVEKCVGPVSGGIDCVQAIRDTEYSSKDCGNLVYHCGIDIFNNHLLRNNGFNFFRQIKDSNVVEYNTFSTPLADNDGKLIKEPIGLTSTTLTSAHTYNLSNFSTFKESYRDNLKEVDGWYGFKNVGTISIDNGEVGGKTVRINRVMNNNKQCEFIDMYPDRSLYSFIPKKNRFRNRLEKNWEYCLTYPYKNDGEKLIDLGITDNENFIKLETSYYTADTGSIILKFKSPVGVTLKKGDNILLKATISGDSASTKTFKCPVISVGDEKGKDVDKIFSVRYSNVSSFVNIDSAKKDDLRKYSFAYKKLSGNSPCKYYIRKMKKLGEYHSEINKIAGGKNIYGDLFGQIIFTDTIVLDKVNNLGMPLDSLYLTIVKNNAGNEEWYGSGITTSSNIEYSHCFGDICCGYEFNTENIFDIRNTYRKNGVYYSSKKGENVKIKSVNPVESGITINNDEFYGDIVEYDNSTISETVICPIMFRFNTAQRETDKFEISHDEIVTDDFTPKIEDGLVLLSGFRAMTDKISGASFNPEGYVYVPHYEVTLREYDTIKSTRYWEMCSGTTGTSISGNVITLPNEGIRFYAGDILCVIDFDDNIIICRFVKNVGNNKIEVDSKLNLTNYKEILRLDMDCPTNGKLNRQNRTIQWKEIKPLSETNGELSEMPFSNGCNYRHTNVNLFLKRQDKFGKRGLLYMNDKMKYYGIQGKNDIDLSEVEYFYNSINYICY